MVATAVNGIIFPTMNAISIYSNFAEIKKNEKIHLRNINKCIFTYTILLFKKK